MAGAIPIIIKRCAIFRQVLILKFDTKLPNNSFVPSYILVVLRNV